MEPGSALPHLMSRWPPNAGGWHGSRAGQVGAQQRSGQQRKVEICLSVISPLLTVSLMNLESQQARGQSHIQSGALSELSLARQADYCMYSVVHTYIQRCRMASTIGPRTRSSRGLPHLASYEVVLQETKEITRKVVSLCILYLYLGIPPIRRTSPLSKIPHSENRPLFQATPLVRHLALAALRAARDIEKKKLTSSLSPPRPLG